MPHLALSVPPALSPPPCHRHPRDTTTLCPTHAAHEEPALSCATCTSPPPCRPPSHLAATLLLAPTPSYLWGTCPPSTMPPMHTNLPPAFYVQRTETEGYNVLRELGLPRPVNNWPLKDLFKPTILGMGAIPWHCMPAPSAPPHEHTHSHIPTCFDGPQTCSGPH